MKFEVSVWTYSQPDKTGPRQNIRGFDNLRDAVAAAWGISSLRGRPPGLTIGVWLQALKKSDIDRPLLGLAGHDRDMLAFLAKCETALKEALAKRKAARDRAQFAKRHGENFYQDVMANEAARQAFCRNDFATVEQLLPKTPWTPYPA